MRVNENISSSCFTSLVVCIILLVPSVVPAFEDRPTYISDGNDISGQETRQTIPNLAWPMFCKDAQHTSNSGNFARRLTDPILLWNTPVSVDSRGMTVGNFSGNIVLNGTSKYDRNTLAAVYSESGTIRVAEARTGTDMWAILLGGTLLGAPALSDFNINGKLDIVAVSSMGNVSCYEPVMNWNGSAYSWNTTNSSNSRLWESGLGAEVSYSSPTVGDVNGDGIDDVVLCAGHTLYVLDGINGSRIWNATLPGNMASTPALLRYDTGGYWIAAQSFNNTGLTLDRTSISLYNDKGVLSWNKTIPLSAALPGTTILMLPSPSVSDLDVDGFPEICALSPFESGNGRMYSYKQDGSQVWNPFQLRGQAETAPAIGDVNNDTIPDIIAVSWTASLLGNGRFSIFAVDGKNGTELWNRTIDRANDFLMTERVAAGPAVADLNRDGRSDVVIGVVNGHLYSFSGSAGIDLWEYNSSRLQLTSSPSIADVEMDGFPEVLIDGMVFTQRIPELFISSSDIIFSNSSPNEGTPVTVTAYIHNSGTKNVDNLTILFNDIYDNTTVQSTEKYINVSASGSSGASLQWVPQGGGSHRMAVIIDPSNAIEEINEQNNQAFKTISVLSHYTVEISCAANESYVDAGAEAPYFVVVTNAGDALNTIVVNLSNVAPGWTATLNKNRLDLEPGERSTLTVMVQSPSNSTAGPFPVNVTARSEISPGNRATVALTTFIRGTYGVRISPDTVTKTIIPDDWLSLTFNVSNTGNAADTIEFTNTTAPQGWMVALSRTEVTLQGKAEANLNVMIHSPLSASEGEMAVVTLTASSTGDVSKYDTAVTTTTVVYPDMAVETIKFYRADGREADGTSVHLIGNRTARVNASVRNIRDNVDVNAVRVQILEGVISIGQEDIPFLEMGSNASVGISWRPLEGQHTIEAMVDPDNSIIESNNNNNNLTTFTYVKSALAASSYLVSGQVTKPGGAPIAGGTVVLSNLRTNQSLSVATGNSGQYSIDLSQVYLGYEEEERVMVTASDGITTCSTVILVYSEDGGKSIDFVLSPGPYDFFLVSDRVQAGGDFQNPAVYKLYFTNLGHTDNMLMVNTSALPAGWTGSLESEGGQKTNLISLAPNSTETCVFRLTPPNTARAGAKVVVRLSATSLNESKVQHHIDTTTTVNPVYSLDIIVEKGPALKPGDTGRFNITVKNNGNGNDTADLNVTVPDGLMATINRTNLAIMAFSVANTYIEVSALRNATVGARNVTLNAVSGGNPSVLAYANLTVTVEPFTYRLQLSGGIGSLQQGDYGSANFSARNTGNVRETFILSARLDSPASLPSGWTYSIKRLGVDTSTLTLDPGELAALELRVVPPEEIIGITNIIFNLSGQSRTDPTRTAVSMVSISVERPDLLVIGAVAFSPAQPRDGQKVKITVTIVNQGYWDSPDIVVQFWRGTEMFGEKFSANIPLNSQTQLSVNWTARQGSHTFKVIVNPSAPGRERVKELNYGNNEVSKYVLVESSSGEFPWGALVGVMAIFIIVGLVYALFSRGSKKDKDADEDADDDYVGDDDETAPDKEDNDEDDDQPGERTDAGNSDEEGTSKETDTEDSVSVTSAGPGEPHEVDAVEVTAEEMPAPVRRKIRKTANVPVQSKMVKKPKKKAPMMVNDVEMPGIIRIG